MLFNSDAFLLLFLPGAAALHALALRFVPALRVPLLLVVSLVFYGLFDARFLPLLAASIVGNWLIGRAFESSGTGALIGLGLVVNLTVLAAFKYLDFLAGLLASLAAAQPPAFDVPLPIGISFFTFGHIAYLIDLKRGRASPASLPDYALYVAFFPKVVAGPLVRPSEFIPQLRPVAPPDAEQVARGLLLLLAGLGKKVFLGDPLGAIVDPLFATAAAGTPLTGAEAWTAVLGYTFQLYFDFSGYTDMAIGVALLFGIVLPQNFDAPYRSVSIQDFWRRWHITLSSFLRDYLYISFGGNRHGLQRQIAALFLTMAIGGLWHGAGLTFVAWGAAHGAALGLHLLWRRAGRRMPQAAGIACTFAFVALAWVLFRAPTFAAASAVYRDLVAFGRWGALPDWPILLVAGLLATLGPTATDLVRRLPPAPWVGIAAALAAAAVLLKVGDDVNYAFIYAQF